MSNSRVPGPCHSKMQTFSSIVYEETQSSGRLGKLSTATNLQVSSPAPFLITSLLTCRVINLLGLVDVGWFLPTASSFCLFCWLDINLLQIRIPYVLAPLTTPINISQVAETHGQFMMSRFHGSALFFVCLFAFVILLLLSPRGC